MILVVGDVVNLFWVVFWECGWWFDGDFFWVWGEGDCCFFGGVRGDLVGDFECDLWDYLSKIYELFYVS